MLHPSYGKDFLFLYVLWDEACDNTNIFVPRLVINLEQYPPYIPNIRAFLKDVYKISHSMPS